VANEGRDGSSVVTVVGQLVGAAAGFVALLYAAGGGVLALRLYLADLPSRTIAAQLPRDLLISIGLAQIILPMLAVAALYAVARIIRGAAAPPPSRLVRQWTERSRRSWLDLVAASAVPALVVAATLGLAARNVREGAKALAWLLPVAFLVTLLVVLLALNLRARLAATYGDSATSWSTVRAVVRMTLVVALVSLPVCVLFAGAFFPLLDAKVCAQSGSGTSGVLIGETSDRTYIGETGKATGPLLVFSIPRSEIKETIIGGNAAASACPAAQPSGG
jgi:hypothetical protein